MPRKPASGEPSPSKRKKPLPKPVSEGYEFEELTVSEKALSEAGWSPTLFEDIKRFREQNNLTEEVIQAKREECFGIAELVKHEMDELQSDALESERLKYAYRSMAVSEEELSLIQEMEQAKARLQSRLQDAIMLPVSKSQLKIALSWCQKNGAWILVGLLGVYVLWTVFHKDAPAPIKPTSTIAQPK